MRRLLLTVAFAAGSWAQSVSILSQDQIQELENKVAQHPEDRQSQKLLGQNYAAFILGITALGTYNTVEGVDASKAASSFAQHSREMLSTSSLAGVVAEGGHALWDFSFQVQGYEVLKQARDRVQYSDARTLGVQALDRAILLEPKNAAWRSYRIPILALRSNSRTTMPVDTADAYTQIKQDLAVLTGASRYNLLASVAKQAVKAGALDNAASYAQELLQSANDPKNCNYGNAIFFGNMVLGQVALRRGDKDQARSHLLAAGKTSGSPQLNSFGPNMSLAKDLLEAGDRQAVLEFFELCRSFWKMDRGRLQDWANQINAGSTPDFGANLAY
ncbi:MAG: hypothetical protein LAP38_17450 [Acidobacteriia bacterium]|nr:hypothetical protein [Terriglobia bacterium]